SLPKFQRSEFVDDVSVWRFERPALLFPTQSDSGARLFRNVGRRIDAAVHPFDVSTVALVGRASGSLRRQTTTGLRACSSGTCICDLCHSFHRGKLLDDVL